MCGVLGDGRVGHIGTRPRSCLESEGCGEDSGGLLRGVGGIRGHIADRFRWEWVRELSVRAVGSPLPTTSAIGRKGFLPAHLEGLLSTHRQAELVGRQHQKFFEILRKKLLTRARLRIY